MKNIIHLTMTDGEYEYPLAIDPSTVCIVRGPRAGALSSGINIHVLIGNTTVRQYELIDSLVDVMNKIAPQCRTRELTDKIAACIPVNSIKSDRDVLDVAKSIADMFERVQRGEE